MASCEEKTPTLEERDLRLISWNVNARRRQATAQVAALAEREPDIVALQEVTPTTVALLRDAFSVAGLSHAVDSLSLAPQSFTPAGPRRYGLLTASRYALTHFLPPPCPVPWPERVLSLTATTPSGFVEIHNTHVPPGVSNGWVKVEHLAGLYEGLAHISTSQRILCGDFNTPQLELPDGEVVTWAQRVGPDRRWRVARRFRGGTGAEWDAAERRVLSGLAEHDLHDVFRQLHGYEISEASWVHERRDMVVRRRFDHVFASAALRPIRCRYLHEVRITGLSDHAPLEVDFA